MRQWTGHGTDRDGNDCGTFFSATGAPCGRVMLVHGLNHDPHSWEDMVSLLTSSGLHVYRIALTGHRGRAFSEMRLATGKVWLQDFWDGYAEMIRLTPEMPTYLVGFSMGALIPLTVQLKENQQLFSRQVLLAPAVRVQLYTRLVLIVSRFVSSLPSRSTSYYVANPEGTTAEAYRAFFEIEREFNRIVDQQRINIPTSVLIRRSDELVSYRGIKAMIERKSLTNWTFTSLKDHDPLPQKMARFQHMVVDRESAGNEGWQQIVKEVRNRFVPHSNFS